MSGDEVNDVRDGSRGQETATGRPSPDADALAATVKDLEDRWRRALADLDNTRKRHARELSQAAEAERRRVTLAWLPVVDNLELALEHSQGDPAALIDGVRAVRDQAVALLASLGYPREDETGVPFDPVRHEATGMVDEPGAPPGTVVRVLRPGYGEPPERQLRPAAVLVSRKQE
ncbi:nucleotide exchange factor GrpE [Catenulispora pinisilvae]|uniref:nucleotide exchange factor GrpE n=1 Tax=Catenulispora pinisilvae TaxID=2705253 RepID=UPI003F69BC24